jgi:hypothetical protein
MSMRSRKKFDWIYHEVKDNDKFWEKLLPRVSAASDVGLDRWVDLLDLHQAELQLIITLSILL